MRDTDDYETLSTMFETGETISIEDKLAAFKTYDATYSGTILHSTTENAQRKFVRASSLTQLGALISDLIRSGYINDAYPNPADRVKVFQKINGFMNIEKTYPNPDPNIGGELTSKLAVEKALDVLEALGVDMSKQREQLKTWPNE